MYETGIQRRGLFGNMKVGNIGRWMVFKDGCLDEIS